MSDDIEKSSRVRKVASRKVTKSKYQNQLTFFKGNKKINSNKVL